MSFKILFLGTGAADGINYVFPNNFNDKDLRRCACALLDGKILLDCGPHTIAALKTAKINPSNITDIIITHLHEDHFCYDAVNLISAANSSLRLWCREDAEIKSELKCTTHKMKAFCEYDINGFKVTGVPANHTEFPQHLSIQKNGKKLFYGLDGAWFLGETVEFIKQKNYDIFVFDATVGDYSGDYRMGEHNSIPMIRLMSESMKTLNVINDKSNLVLSHMAMCLNKGYAETCKLTENDNFIVAYDGLTLSI